MIGRVTEIDVSFQPAEIGQDRLPAPALGALGHPVVEILRDAGEAQSGEAALIDWQTPFSQVCDYNNPPFAKWFVGGKTNLCHNAVDRHAASHPDRNALIWVSTEVEQERVYSFAELQARIAAVRDYMASFPPSAHDGAETRAVTIKMRAVPWDQALDVILTSKGLGMVRRGNLIRVAPQAIAPSPTPGKMYELLP